MVPKQDAQLNLLSLGKCPDSCIGLTCSNQRQMEEVYEVYQSLLF